MTDNREPANEWATKKELIYSTLGFLVFGILCVISLFLSGMDAVIVFGVAFFFFVAGVSSAPLFYKFWFKRND
jgi:preprotein translocase subunit SecE